MQLFHNGTWFELVVFLGTDPGRLDLPGRVEDDREDDLVLAFADAITREREYFAHAEEQSLPDEDW